MSAQKLREFIAHVKRGGIAKSSHYFVDIALPPCLQGYSPVVSNLKKILLFCERTEIPGVNLDTIPVRTYGETREAVSAKVYDPLQMSFYVDNDFLVKQMFDTWIDSIYSPTTRHINYSNIFTAEKIEIFVQDSEDKDRYCVTLHEAFPKTIAPIQLSYDSKDIMRMQVTFSYKYATYTNYGYPSRSRNIVELFNNPLQSVLQNGIGGAISGISNFDYGFSTFAIPDNYFSSFSSFQQSLSFRPNSIGDLASPDDLSGTEYI